MSGSAPATAAPPVDSTARTKGAVLVLAAAALFGTIGTARVLGPSASSASVGGLRLLIAAVLLLLLAARHGWGSLASSWRQPAVWVAGVAQASFNLTFLGAVTHAGVAVGTLISTGCTPILTGLATRHFTRHWVVATVLAICGLTALLSQGFGSSGVTLVGVLLAFGAALSYSTFILASYAVGRSTGDMTIKVAAIFSVAAVVLSPSLVLLPLQWAGTASGLAMVIYLAVAATVLAYSLFNRGLRLVPAGTAATLALAEPLIATVLGVVVLQEQLSLIAWLGAAVVIVALGVMVHGDRPAPEQPVQAGGPSVAVSRLPTAEPED